MAQHILDPIVSFRRGAQGNAFLYVTPARVPATIMTPARYLLHRESTRYVTPARYLLHRESTRYVTPARYLLHREYPLPELRPDLLTLLLAAANTPDS